MGLLDDILQLLEVLGLVEDSDLGLVGSAPVGDDVEVIRQRSVAEDLSLLVLGAVGEGEGAVGGGTAEEEQCSVTEALAEVGVTGGGRVGGGRA